MALPRSPLENPVEEAVEEQEVLDTSALPPS